MRTTSTYGINRRLFCRVAGACALCKACMPYEPNVPVEIRYRSTPRRPALANTAEYTRTLRGDPDRAARTFKSWSSGAKLKEKHWYERSTVRGGTRPRGGARTAPTRNIRRPRGGRLRRRYLARPRHPAVDSSSSRYDMIAHSHAHRLRRPHLLALKQADSRPSPNPLARLLPMVSSPKLRVSPSQCPPGPTTLALHFICSPAQPFIASP